MKIQFRAAILFAIGLYTQAQAQSTCVQAPADPKADGQAKALVCYLGTHSYISGQTDMVDAERVQKLTGRFPAIVAFDFYGYTDGNAGANAQNTNAAIAYGKKHGIVAFQWHWKAPKPGGRGEYYDDWDFPSALSDPNSQMRKDIQLVMGELKKIGDAGVPVLFRPLHEANNNFMWWQRHGTDNYKKLWKLLFDEAAKAGAHNLVWNFNGMAAGQGTALGDWYPGDDLVDVISSDYYQSWGDYNTMKAISGKKILGVAETWFALDPAKDPPFSHSVVWASRDWPDPKHGGVVAVENAWKTAMSNAKTIDQEQVPAWKNDPVPVVLAVPADVRVSNTTAAMTEIVDVAKVFRDTLPLVYSVVSSGSSSIAAKLNGTKLDLSLKAGDTGTATLVLTATNTLKFSSSASFKVFLKDYHKGNLALHQPAFASSNDGFGGGASAAFDGDAGTRWSSDYTDDEWLAVDLDSVLAVDSVSIFWEDAHATSYQIQTSTDSVTWKTVLVQPASTGGNESLVFPATRARFVRMKGVERATKYGYSIWEMQVFGPNMVTGVATRGAIKPASVKFRREADHLLFEVASEGPFDLQIRDLRGNLVQASRGQASTTISGTNLRPGLYQSILTDASGHHAGQFLVTP